MEHFPHTDEIYTAKFWRNEQLECNDELELIFELYFIDVFNIFWNARTGTYNLLFMNCVS